MAKVTIIEEVFTINLRGSDDFKVDVIREGWPKEPLIYFGKLEERAREMEGFRYEFLTPDKRAFSYYAEKRNDGSFIKRKVALDLTSNLPTRSKSDR